MIEDDHTDSSGDSTSEEQVGDYVSLRTSPTSGGLGRTLNPHSMILTLTDCVDPDISASTSRANLIPLTPSR